MKISISYRTMLFSTLIFVILRLGGVTSWSWVWVLSPLWLPYVVFGLLFVILATLAVLFGSVK